MTDSIESASKVRRDYLLASMVLIFVNLAEVKFNKFSIFGIEGSFGAPYTAYMLVVAVWLYFSYRYYVKATGNNQSLAKLKSDFVASRAVELAKMEAFEEGNDVDERRNIDVYERKDGGLVIDVPKKRESLDDIGVFRAEYDPPMIKNWVEDFEKRSKKLHEFVLDAVIPIVVLFLAGITTAARAISDLAEFL